MRIDQQLSHSHDFNSRWTHFQIAYLAAFSHRPHFFVGVGWGVGGGELHCYWDLVTAMKFYPLLYEGHNFTVV